MARDGMFLDGMKEMIEAPSKKRGRVVEVGVRVVK
jgi:hypothetical protein